MCPQSRWAGLSNWSVQKSIREGTTNPLAMLNNGELVIFEIPSSHFVGHMGHPEYNETRLVQEYLRDGGLDGQKPINLDISFPSNRWRSHKSNFFNSWLAVVENNFFRSRAKLT